MKYMRLATELYHGVNKVSTQAKTDKKNIFQILFNLLVCYAILSKIIQHMHLSRIMRKPDIC